MISAPPAFPRRELPAARRACVAIGVVPHEDGEGVILTTRALGLRAHAAQFALPGGMCEPGEGYAETAIRETHEEVGVEPQSWTVVDVLDDFAVGGLVVTPVVLRTVDRPTFLANADEVAAVHIVPVPRSVPVLQWMPPDQQPGTPTEVAAAQALRIGEFEMYAPTGAILWQFMSWWIAREVRRVAGIAPPQFVLADYVPRGD